MRTVLSRFSQAFVRSVGPLLAPLEATAQGFSEASPELPGREALPDLREIHHQIEVLVNKVADQHAFVLIFGPLKSGKSTLMNALSAAYVSEVSSLPAYPCMVYVSHAQTRGFEVTRYNGSTDHIDDASSLKAYIEGAHADLVTALRRAEDEGQEFDPAVHFPQAIRRIDVKVPAKALERSGAVLVDTPGLYSRMKFGYDRMTRDFRNAAASAIFVVKSDNLFLEQVFDEFNELLDLFSRIFLIVNVDSTKMDLGSKGELVPSLEQEDPERIVQAFQNYAMNSPLKRAAEEGRLRIYPIDLLRAASRRLQETIFGMPAEENEEAAELEEPQGLGAEDRGSFSSFLSDLTRFLNSNDYMIAFVNDSIRRADTLLEDTDDLLERDSIRRIGSELEELWNDKVETQRRRQAVEKLSEFGWEAAFDDFEHKLANLVRDRMRVSSEQTSHALDEAVEAWFSSDDSLQNLIEGQLKPLFSEHHESLSRFVQETLSREASGVAGGINVSPEITEELHLADIKADEMARKAMRNIRAAVPPAPVGSPFSTSDIPVKKRMSDWMLLRRRNSVRRRIFGPTATPSQRIAKSDKQARLGVEARQAMKKAVDRYKGEFFQATSDGVRENVLAQYATAMSKSLRKELDARREELVSGLAMLEGKVKEYGSLQDKLDELRAAVASARRTVAELDEQEGSATLVPHPGSDAETEAEQSHSETTGEEPEELATETRRESLE